MATTSRSDPTPGSPTLADPGQPGLTPNGAAGELTLLREMPIFGAVPDRALMWLGERAERLTVAAGGWFFQQGAPGDSMYVLRRGRVAVQRTGDGETRIIGRLGVGDCFGEMALIDLEPRSAGVLAEEDCDALALSHILLYRLYAADPEPFTLIMMNLARELSRRLRLTEEILFRHALPAPLVWHRPPTPVAETPFV